MALIYKDTILETCRCSVTDEQKGKIDPTGTRSIRNAMKTALAINWRRVKSDLRKQLLERDILGASSTSQMSSVISMAGTGADRIEMFNNYFGSLVASLIVEDTSIAQRYIGAAYDKGLAFGRKNVAPGTYNIETARVRTFIALAKAELQGIADAVTQAASRIVANGILQASKPIDMARAIYDRIEKVGISRSNALAELIVVGAFTDASLSVYEAAGHEAVGVVPERLLRATDQLTDAKKKRPVKRTGKAAKRARRATAKKIAEAEKVEAKLSKLGRVRVITAEDDDVCVVCEEIAKRGPYKINTARALIPAHPHCRCAFVPVDDPTKPNPIARKAEGKKRKPAKKAAKKTTAKKKAKKK